MWHWSAVVNVVICCPHSVKTCHSLFWLASSSFGVQDHSKVLPREKETFPIDTTTHTFILEIPQLFQQGIYMLGRAILTPSKNLKVQNFPWETVPIDTTTHTFILEIPQLFQQRIYMLGQAILTPSKNLKVQNLLTGL